MSPSFFHLLVLNAVFAPALTSPHALTSAPTVATDALTREARVVTPAYTQHLAPPQSAEPRSVELHFALADVRQTLSTDGQIHVTLSTPNRALAQRVKILHEWDAKQRVWTLSDRYPARPSSAAACPIPVNGRGDYWSQPLRWQLHIKAPRHVRVTVTTLSP